MAKKFVRFQTVSAGHLFKARGKMWIKLVDLKKLSTGRRVNAFEVDANNSTVNIKVSALFDETALVCDVTENVAESTPSSNQIFH